MKNKTFFLLILCLIPSILFAQFPNISTDLIIQGKVQELRTVRYVFNDANGKLIDSCLYNVVVYDKKGNIAEYRHGFNKDTTKYKSATFDADTTKNIIKATFDNKGLNDKISYSGTKPCVSKIIQSFNEQGNLSTCEYHFSCEDLIVLEEYSYDAAGLPSEMKVFLGKVLWYDYKFTYKRQH